MYNISCASDMATHFVQCMHAVKMFYDYVYFKRTCSDIYKRSNRNQKMYGYKHINMIVKLFVPANVTNGIATSEKRQSTKAKNTARKDQH